MSHPSHCRGCRGAGYRPAPPIHTTAHGRPHIYTTVKPCEHDHWNDDPHTEHLPATHPRAQTAHEDGYQLGQHDLWNMSGGQLGKEHPNARKRDAA